MFFTIKTVTFAFLHLSDQEYCTALSINKS